ncbi:14-3-3 protein epsilon [Histoplasma capsulatum G186AR]|uniref:14-3-3 protein epsilon n=1 Tax=Ajellomyces capsulatus TaxID=5037 RepID=A0A8H8CTS4_AJECA|nr:14-3-3 protein epsilon [Histoplasma capsulatum]QSS71058.1 14-3-3 protein epsilon [Histoplasma capsulatum G186AR]
MEGWLSLECFRRGTSPDRQNNPPTIVLSIPLDAPRTWKAERDQITALLDDEGLQEVAVEVVRSYIWRTTDMDLTSVILPDNAWEQKAQLGMSIAPHGSDYSGSTFGGFLQLLHPSTKQWNTFGLTCYHCVDSEEGSNDSSRLSKDVKEWRETGMRVDQAKSANILIDQPALKDHMKRMELIEEATEDWMKSPIRERIEAAVSNNEFITPTDEAQYKRFQDNINQLLTIKHKAEKFFAAGDALLGRVSAASRYRFTSFPMKRQLDWALIEIVTPRIGSNNVPPTGSYRDGFADFSGQLMEQSSVNDPPHGSALYKIGRRTNFTSGRYQGLHSVHLESWKTDKTDKKAVAVMEEAAVTDKNGLQFCAPGDSGSFIFDVETKFVGLLFAGNMETGVGYFTPAAILFEDIKAMTGALEVRLPLS